LFVARKERFKKEKKEKIKEKEHEAHLSR